MKYRIVSSVEVILIYLFIFVFLFLSAFAVAQDQQTEMESLDSEQVESQNGADAEIQDSEMDKSENGTDAESQKTEEVESGNSDEFESQMYELKTTLYCFCGCDRMTYEICHCVTAEYMKEEFLKSLKAGQTVEAIRDAYLEEHGPQYSAVMDAEGINLLAYIMPAVILLVVGGVAIVLLQNSRMNKVGRTQPDTEISEEMQRQLESELEKYKEQN